MWRSAAGPGILHVLPSKQFPTGPVSPMPLSSLYGSSREDQYAMNTVFSDFGGKSNFSMKRGPVDPSACGAFMTWAIQSFKCTSDEFLTIAATL